MVRQYFNWRNVLVVAALGIIAASIWYANFLSKKIQKEEQQRVEEWVSANKVFNTSNENNAITLSTLVITNNEDIPLILTTDKDSIIEARNIDSAKILADTNYLKNQLQLFKNLRPAIIMPISDSPKINYQVYYGNTPLLGQVYYYPIVQLLIMALFIIIALSMLATKNKSTQNQVWAGMAKETAHQMGTPLSSLEGWVELLKPLEAAKAIVPEMEKDVNRLKLVSERFSKIGSQPQLVETNITQQIAQMQDYIKRRASGKVAINFVKPSDDVTALISPPLFDWVLENLLKNALDAIDGKGQIIITLTDNVSNCTVDVSDTGKGININNQKNVFKPGFTTKKRGWGLGLTLSKRIMEQYHRGELFIKQSEVGKGTTFRIVVNK
jgi:signal transduction histidine kinase